MAKRKVVYFKADLYQNSHNYLVNTFFDRTMDSKSAYAVLILQILKAAKKPLSRQELLERLSDDGSKVAGDLALDDQTGYRIITKLASYGLIARDKDGKKFTYRLGPNPLADLTLPELQDLYDVAGFYANLSLLSVPGYYLLDTLKSLAWQQYAAQLQTADFYQYRFNSFARVVDDGVIFGLQEAIRLKQPLRITYEQTGRKVEQFILLPKAIYTEYPYHRQYLVAAGGERYKVECISGFEKVSKRLAEEPKKKSADQCVEFVFAYTEETDPRLVKQVQNRLKREAAWMKCQELAPGRYLYTGLVQDALAYVPWLRTWPKLIKLTDKTEAGIRHRLEADRKECLANYGLV